MNMTKWVFIGAAAAIICACASADSGVQVSSQSTATYPPTPISGVKVSSHPPMGQYVVIANLTADAQINETPTHLLSRLQASGASLGADYVMVTSVSDKTFAPEENSFVADNPYLSQEDNFFSTASPAATGYNHEYNIGQSPQREVITAKALKITSGTNKPNKAAPSNLWQIRTQ